MIPDDAFDKTMEYIMDFLTDTWPTTDLQDVINLAVVIDNIYHGYDEDGNKRTN